MVAAVEAAIGPVDLLVNNAGQFGPVGPLAATDPDDWWRALEVNLRGPFALLRAGGPAGHARPGPWADRQCLQRRRSRGDPHGVGLRRQQDRVVPAQREPRRRDPRARRDGLRYRSWPGAHGDVRIALVLRRTQCRAVVRGRLRARTMSPPTCPPPWSSTSRRERPTSIPAATSTCPTTWRRWWPGRPRSKSMASTYCVKANSSPRTHTRCMRHPEDKAGIKRGRQPSIRPGPGPARPSN